MLTTSHESVLPSSEEVTAGEVVLSPPSGLGFTRKSPLLKRLHPSAVTPPQSIRYRPGPEEDASHVGNVKGAREVR